MTKIALDYQLAEDLQRSLTKTKEYNKGRPISRVTTNQDVNSIRGTGHSDDAHYSIQSTYKYLY